jgi:hypothetical protein
MLTQTFPLAAISLALCLAAPAVRAQSAIEAELARKLDQLAAELANVKAQLATLQQQRAAAVPGPAPAAGPAAPVASAAPVAPAAPAVADAAPVAGPATVLTSYAELNYNRPTSHTQDTQFDMRRFVLGYQHRFDERTKVVTELEVEHGVASADDPGEVEVEQAYVERQLNGTWALRGGLFLMPMGLLNENHEPTAFYGVERNFVETAIIPSTWREGGVQFVGAFGNGLTLQTGVSTGFDLNKWDATSTEGRESPLGAVHQELALAKSRDVSVFGALNWRGIPGLQLGGGLFTGGASQGQAVASSRVTLWDLHARWTPGAWDLSALYARGTISNTAAFNLPLVGSASLIPAAFDGGYLQAAYKLWRHEDLSLAPFVRWERYNTASSYADLGPGLTPDATAAERVWTVGANFGFGDGLVFKADVQRFGRDKDNNRLNLGFGWSF